MERLWIPSLRGLSVPLLHRTRQSVFVTVVSPGGTSLSEGPGPAELGLPHGCLPLHQFGGDPLVPRSLQLGVKSRHERRGAL